MVLIHLKRSDKFQFLHEAPHTTLIEDLTVQLVHLNNELVRLEKLVHAADGLREFGPLRPEALRGLTIPETIEPALQTLSSQELQVMKEAEALPHIMKQDPTGYRTGRAPIESVANKIHDACQEARKLLNPTLVDSKVILTKESIAEAILLLRGGVMIAYPAYHGLPDWEPTKLLLEGKLDLIAQYPDCEWVDEPQAVLWWAKKELAKGKTLGDYAGKNDKTKLIIKIMPRGKGAPLAEPPIDQETHKKMLSYYYKKQEEIKKLEEDSNDHYLDSAWANPSNLKHQLHNGGQPIKFKPGMR